MGYCNRSKSSFAFLLAFLLFTGASAIAQQRLILQRLRGPVTLDGVSNEPAWNDIAPLPFVMQQPTFGLDPSEKTVVLLAYDDEYIYVAGRLYDSDSAGIQSASLKRDFMGGNSDWFGFILDTFNDKENAVAFFTTPSGLRLDIAVFNDAQGDFPFNPSWNTFWDVAVERNGEGWFVEMRVPFSSLRFQESDSGVVMGFTSWRFIARKFEIDVFPAIPPKWGFWSAWKPSRAREIVLEGVRGYNPLYIAPYLLGGFGHTTGLNDEETAYDRTNDFVREAGVDIKYGLTDNLTLDLSVNTDFAQVEADDEQVNLTRFSLFFPEKRLFFQERSSNFDFNMGGPTSLFYSRRIGIRDGKPVRIYGGVRLVGRAGPWDLGFLSMQTAPVDDLASENFGVLRVRRRIINENTYVGGIVTSRLGMDGSRNVAYGLDGIFRLSEDDYIVAKWAQTFENGKANDPVSLDPARVRVNWEKRTIDGLGLNLGYSRAGKDYNPGMGFELREDYTRFGNRVWYGWIPGEESTLLRHQVFLGGFVFLRNKDGSAESYEIGPGWDFTTKVGYTGNVSVRMYYDEPDTFALSAETEIPAGRYRYYGVSSGFSTPFGDLFYVGMNFDAGSFYDGWNVSLGVSPNWSVSSSLELGGAYQYYRVWFPARNQELTVHIARVRATLMFSTEVSIVAFVQYNSAREAVIANLRFRYNPREGNDLYLVYDEGLNTNRYRRSPAPPLSGNRTVLVKYTYTFTL